MLHSIQAHNSRFSGLTKYPTPRTQVIGALFSFQRLWLSTRPLNNFGNLIMVRHITYIDEVRQMMGGTDAKERRSGPTFWKKTKAQMKSVILSISSVTLTYFIFYYSPHELSA